MKLFRITSGRYKSKDGRVEIRRWVYNRSGKRIENLWSVAIDSNELARFEDTKRDAVKIAERRLKMEKKQGV